jgi:lysophospholipase L1-like esterase
MSRYRRLLLGLLVSCAVLATLELVLRLSTEEADLLFAWEHPDGMIKLLGDQVYVREAVSHSLTDGPYTWEVQTNGLGLREDAQTPPIHPAGSTRWLALGDSWVFGTSVTQGKTISDQLELILTAQTGAEVEVLNGAIPGGSAFEMLVRWSELSSELALDGLILGLPHNQRRQGVLSEQRRTLYSPTGGAPYLNLRIYLLARHMLAPYTRPRYADGDVAIDAMNPSTVRDLRTIVAQASAREIPTVAIEWPNDMRLAMQSVNPPAERWRAILEPMGVRFGGHALNTRSCWGFEDHGHPSEAGARAIAEVLATVMTGEASPERLQTAPTCDSIPGVGPGKGDWPVE